MNEEMKQWIDEASYEQLLRRWRFEPSGSQWFCGEVGAYYAKVMKEKRALLDDNGVRASKNVGWK